MRKKPISLKCRVCKKPKEFTMRRDVPIQAYLSDPFCSSTCARKFYKTELPPPEPAGRKRTSVTRT